MVLLFLGILVDVGFNVTFVLDGVAAIETLKQRPIDFIILDIRLPGMDGFELYERLQVNPETQMIPVLITTALNGQYRFLKIRSRGVRHYLARPFTENELLEAILVLLKKKRADKNEKTDP